MYFAFGFVLLPTIALTSPMLHELLDYPADSTGYMNSTQRRTGWGTAPDGTCPDAD